MAKKKTTEEQIIKDAADTIMRTIHIASARIADKYERQLMTEVVTRIQTQMEANDEVNNYTGEMINDKLNDLSQ